tara:strand:- start:1812 stop:2516 length:705 start_codon:yes stop_codon:yes gene_type:complete
MTIVFKKNNCTILKKKDSYELLFKKINKKIENILFESLNINKIITQKKCLKTGICKINFKANSLVSLKDLIRNKKFLNYNNLSYLFLFIKNQIMFLKKNNIGILFFSIDDIICIKNNKNIQFFFLNSNNLFEIEDDEMIVTKSFEKKNPNNFLSPELLTINSIPFNINYKSSFFSLASLVAFCINGKKIDIFNPINWNADDNKLILQPIENTKLYWALLRCKKINPNDRYLLWI